MKTRRVSSDNRGFTLVELVISMAILSIVLVTAYAMMSSASNAYVRSSRALKNQREGNTALAQVTSKLVDTRTAVVWKANGALTISGSGRRADQTIDAGQNLYLINDQGKDPSGNPLPYEVTVYHYDPVKKTVYYGVSETEAFGDSEEEIEKRLLSLTADHRLAEDVERFSFTGVPEQSTTADGTVITTIKSGKMTLEKKDHSEEFASEQTVSFRNRPEYGTDFQVMK